MDSLAHARQGRPSHSVDEPRLKSNTRAAMPPSLLAGLQGTVGNAVVARMIQRKDLGTPPKPMPKKHWMTGGTFEQNHLLSEALSDDSAKAKWTERWAREKKQRKRDRPVPNTVTAEADFQSALDAGQASGTYPVSRDARAGIKVTVAGKTVMPGRNETPGRVIDVTEVGVAGSGTDSLYFPDHYESA